MNLVGQFDSPFVRRVAITLHIYGFAFQRNTMSVFTNAAELSAINPLGRVPALLLDDGEVLIDSSAILDHLDEIAPPERRLMPDRGPDRRRVLQIVAIATGAADKAIALVYERLFHSPESISETWNARCRGQMEKALGELERQCGDSWFAGGRFSQADVTTACVVGYLKLRFADIDIEHHWPKLARHLEACEALPAFYAARPGANETIPAR